MNEIDEGRLRAQNYYFEYWGMTTELMNIRKTISSDELNEYVEQLIEICNKIQRIMVQTKGFPNKTGCYNSSSTLITRLIDKNYTTQQLNEDKGIANYLETLDYGCKILDQMLIDSSEESLQKIVVDFNPIYEKAVKLLYELTGKSVDELLYLEPEKILVYKI